jgi:hypothetical protein
MPAFSTGVRSGVRSSCRISGNGFEQIGLPNGGASSVEHDGGEPFDGRAGEPSGLQSPLRHGRYRLFVESNGGLTQPADESPADRLGAALERAPRRVLSAADFTVRERSRHPATTASPTEIAGTPAALSFSRFDPIGRCL